MATDNFQAGFLIGAYAKAKMGDAAKDAKIGFLNINPQQVTVDVLRNQGFMSGFGIDVKNPNGSATRMIAHRLPRLYQRQPEGGRKAMEKSPADQSGHQRDPHINEPAGPAPMRRSRRWARMARC